MSEKIDRCVLCEKEGSLQKLPSFSFSTFSVNNSGKLVKEFIADSKTELEVDKEKLRQDYKV